MNADILKRLNFEPNLGVNSQQNRYLIGGIIVTFAVFYGYLSILILGFLVIATAYVRRCPVLHWLKKETIKTESKLLLNVPAMLKFGNNLGKASKKNRYIAGGVLLLLCMLTNYLILFPLALIMFATAFFGWCPVYAGIGKNTCGN